MSENTTLCVNHLPIRIRQFAADLLDSTLEAHLSTALCRLTITIYGTSDIPFRSLNLSVYPSTTTISTTKLSFSVKKPVMSLAFQRDYGSSNDSFGFEHRVIRDLAHELVHVAQQLGRGRSASALDRERNAYTLEVCFDYQLLDSTRGPQGAAIPTTASISTSAIRHSADGARLAAAVLTNAVAKWPLSSMSADADKKAFIDLCNAELLTLRESQFE
jgi:hypothetical protein